MTGLRRRSTGTVSLRETSEQLGRVWHHKVVHTNGVRIHLVEEGQGPLVLLLHGASGFWLSWRHQIPAFVDAGYRVAAIDMRGFGRSSRPTRIDAYRITEIIADCVGVVEALGESQAVVMGHDFGSVVAWTAAWTHPDVFRAVAGLSVPFGGRSLIPIAGASSFGQVRPSEASRIVAGDPDIMFYLEYRSIIGALEEEVELDLDGYLRAVHFNNSADAIPPGAQLPDPLDVTPDDVLAYIRASSTCIPRGARMRDRLKPAPHVLPHWLASDVDAYVAEFERTGLTGAMNHYRAMDLSWELLEPYVGKPVGVPALYLTGAVDVTAVWGSEAISRFGDTVPHLQELAIVPDAGHWVARERPAEVNEILVRFLNSVPTT